MCNKMLATLDAALFDSYNCSDLEERFAISMSVRRSLSRSLPDDDVPRHQQRIQKNEYQLGTT